MPIEKSFALKQVLRLSGLPYFSPNQEAIDELVAALASESRTKADAVGSIDAILSDVARASSPTTNRAPSPGEIRAWVRDRIGAAENVWVSPAPPKWCLRCSGSGKIGDPAWVPDWSMSAAEIDAACEAAKISCPQCAAVPA